MARRALGEGVADLREELDLVALFLVGLGLGLIGGGLLLHALVEGVHRDDDAQVERDGHEQEVDDRGDQDAELHVGTVQGEDEGVGEVGLADDSGDEGVDDAVDEGIDDVLEGGTDDDTDGELDGVTARDDSLNP